MLSVLLFYTIDFESFILTSRTFGVISPSVSATYAHIWSMDTAEVCTVPYMVRFPAEALQNYRASQPTGE
jgi:hypothetical protein